MQQEQQLPDDLEHLLQRFHELEGHEDGQGTEDGIEEIDVYFVRRPKKEEDTEQVIESTPQPSPRRTIPVASCFALAVNIILFLCVLIFAIVPELTASVTITIIPVEKQISSTATIFAVEGAPRSGQIHVRFLPSLTLTQSKSVLATGHGHQNAKQAQGFITFYNGLFESQTVAAGTTLTGADGVQVVTDQVAIIPAAIATTPPIYGHVTVSAHAIQTGSQGNISVRDINQACCVPSVLAQNTASFQGGQNQRDYSYVTKSDIQSVAATLMPSLTQSIHAALQAQLTTNEGLVTLPCSPTISTDHRIGEEAHEVNVTVSERCTGLAYNEVALQSLATQLLTQQAVQQAGTSYGLVGAIQTNVISATISDQKQGGARITVKASGTWFYHISSEQAQQMKSLLAGKSQTQGKHLLLSMPGIQGVTMQGLADNQSVPMDISHIHLLIVYGAS